MAALFICGKHARRLKTGTENFDQDQGAMRRGCNDCAVGPVSCISGSTAPTMARSKQIVGALRQSRRISPFPAALL